jgi:hypothetical protein
VSSLPVYRTRIAGTPTYLCDTDHARERRADKEKFYGRSLARPQLRAYRSLVALQREVQSMRLTRCLIGLAAAAALSLGACQTAGTGGVAVGPADAVSQVQSLASKVCGFLPLAETVSALLGVPSLGGVEGVASSICSAVTRRMVSRGGAKTPIVAGVPVRGRFLNSG